MFVQIRRIILGVLLVLMLSGCGAVSAGSDALPVSSAAAEYCTKNGGEVETRYPFYGTNNANPLQLAGSMQICTFTLKEDGSRIFVALDTLYSDQPTLASSAYRTKQPMKPADSSVNPSSVYCSQLGGTDLFGGVNASGGGWARKDAEDVIAMCVFADLSSIDSWGLTYHSEGTIRGADLTELFRYQGSKP